MRKAEIQDHRAYEQECVEGVRHAFSGRNELLWLEDTGRELRRVELRGTFPDTELLVTIHDRRFKPPRERMFGYPLWDSDETNIYGKDSEFQPEPNLMAANIFIWTMEE